MFWEKFLGLCSLKGLKPNRVAAELGISSGSVTKWKNGSVPSTENMRRLAAFFGVTVDWLTGNSQFRTQQELNRCLESWRIGSTGDFNPPYDFCPLLREPRESMGISAGTLAAEIGLTAEQYLLCEAGSDPITWEQAIRLSGYFSTTPRQLMQERAAGAAAMPVPAAYRLRMNEWERLCGTDAFGETQPQQTYFGKIMTRLAPMTEEEQKKVWEILRTVFGEEEGQA